MRLCIPAFFLSLFLSSWNGLAAQSKIYGTTTLGGANGVGVIYSMNTDGSNYQVLYSFQQPPDGGQPTGKLVPGPGGKLYGFTPLGGTYGYGTIFSWDTTGQTYQKLLDLDSVHAAAPAGNPLFFNGMIYGLGKTGGPKNNGTIFTYDLSSGTLADVYDFAVPTGINPFGSITVWNNIFFFETTLGAAYGSGSVMSFDPATATAVDLYDFGVNAFASTMGTELLLYNNLLYGTTEYGGGSRLGCIFSIDPRTGAFRDLWNFANYVWGQYAQQLTAYHGMLYGIAWYGGVSGTAGTLYSFDPVALVYTKLYDWQADAQPTVDGANPVGPVVIDSTGMLYGQTQGDGPNGAGVIYNFNINTSTYNILFGFNWTVTGGGPRYGFILQ